MREPTDVGSNKTGMATAPLEAQRALAAVDARRPTRSATRYMARAAGSATSRAPSVIAIEIDPGPTVSGNVSG